MKVSVITRHAVANYGSLLQAIATQRAVEMLGHECEVVDYVRSDETVLRSERTLLESKPKWSSSFLRRIVYLALRVPESVLANTMFSAERRKALRLSRRYSSLDELRRNPPAADVYMTGSDQVWGPVMCGAYDPAYLLEYVPEGCRLVAYGSSFGKRVPSGDAEHMFCKGLSRYDAIAVREDTAVAQLGGWGIPAEQVLDPTLLLPGDVWRSAMSVDGGCKRRMPYALVYQIHSDPRVGAYAERAASHLGLPLIRVSAYAHQMSREGRLVFLPCASDFLRLIDDAEILVTDSFHGTAFAINMNTPFVEVLPNTGTASRNASILRLTGLEDRVLGSDNDLELAGRPINFAPVNAIVIKERERSMKVLRRLIEGGAR